jgi:hypothetical protein
VRKLRNILLYALGALPLFLMLVAGFTQTGFFRDRLRTVALAGLDSVLRAEVRLGELRGNLISGFSLDSVTIRLDGRDVVTVDRIDLAYDPFTLPSKTITIRGLTLVHPVIILERPAGGEWNFNRIVRSTQEDTTASTWRTVLGECEIIDGTITLRDSSADEVTAEARDTASADRPFNYHNFVLSRVALKAAARLEPGRTALTIASLSFSSDTPGITLQSLRGSFAVTRGEAVVDSLRIVTPRSNVSVTASMKGIDLLHGIVLAKLRRAPVHVTLMTAPVCMDELKQLLTPVSFLTGNVTTDLQVEGEFGSLFVDRLDLAFGSTSLHLAGKVNHLHDPGDLQLDVEMGPSLISPGDVPALMPLFRLPDYSAVGLTAMTMTFKGSPRDFTTTFDLSTGAGRIVSPGVALKIGTPKTLMYSGRLQFENVDLATVFGDSRLASRLTGACSIDGAGVTLPQLAAHASLSIDTSLFRGLPVTETRLAMVASGRSLQGDGTVSLGGMQMKLNGEIHTPEGVMPSYRLDADITSLDLEPLLRDTTLNSDLTMTIALAGSGKSWKTLNGTISVSMDSSRVRDYTIKHGNFLVTLDQRGQFDKLLKLESNIADISLAGQFDLPVLGSALASSFSALVADAVEKIAAMDSSLESAPRHTPALVVSDPEIVPEPIDARYKITIKDLEPLAAAAGRRTFNGKGEISGTISGRPGALSVSSALRIDNFFYGSAEKGVLIEGAVGNIAMDSLRPVVPLNALSCRIRLGAEKLLVNRTHFDSLFASVTYGRDTAEFQASTLLNEAFRLRTAGRAMFDANTLDVRIDSLRAGYRSLIWTADPGAVLHFNHVSAGINSLVLRSDSQRVACSFTLGRDRSLHGTVVGTRLNLDDLRFLSAEGEGRARNEEFAGTAQIEGELGGTPDHPVYTAHLSADSVSFRGLPFGRIGGEIAYSGGIIESHIQVHEPGNDRTTVPVMTVDGSLPVDLRLERDEELPDRAMDLKIVSKGVQMNILDPLLPTFNDLNGVMTCDVDMQGSLHHPTYHGTIGIRSCSFVFVPNNIAYSLEGSFHPSGDRIAVDDCVIRNVKEDQKEGREGLVHITGDFALRDLRPGDFNLTANGQLLVVKETTRKSALEVYGNLFIEIGPGPLHFTGEVERSLLKGAVLIRNSTLVFPPSTSAAVQESPMSVPVTFVNDTARAVAHRDLSVESRYLGVDSTVARKNRDERSISFMDGLRYDLDIETAGGNSEIRLIFNAATNEELVATMDGKFNISEDGRHWTGDLTISRAYYNFFKRFDATGSLRYTGDFMNPDLDITAKYQGTRTLAGNDSTSGSRNEKVVVNAKITGTRLKPKIDFAMTIDDVDYYAYSSGPKSNDLQSDAIQFIVAGTFPLTAAQREEMRSTVGQSVLTGATSLFTGQLSDFLQGTTGFIRSVDLNVGTRETTELRLSGTAWDGYWQYSGTILNDPLSNASLSILYSFGTIFRDPLLRNFMLELERRVDPVTYGQVSDLKRINSARIFYRFSF